MCSLRALSYSPHFFASCRGRGGVHKERERVRGVRGTQGSSRDSSLTMNVLLSVTN